MLGTADEFRFARQEKRPIVLAKLCQEYQSDLGRISLPAIQVCVCTLPMDIP